MPGLSEIPGKTPRRGLLGVTVVSDEVCPGTGSHRIWGVAILGAPRPSDLHDLTIRISLMRYLCFLVLGLLAACSGARTGARSSATAPAISYRVSWPDFERETFRVEGILENLAADSLTINFPIWTPGAYDLVYFGRYVK